MTEPETPQPVSDTDSLVATATDVAPEPEPEPPPEPWTPERVSEWNAYYDVYVKWAALLLVFIVSCNYVTDSSLWLNLKTGQAIAEKGAPLFADEFSYTEAGKPWIDIPWLFQWMHAALYKLVLGWVPVNPMDTTANRAGAEQIAVGTLVGIDAIVRLLTAWLVLKIRHAGPGLWWSAIAVTLALGVIFHPYMLVMVGGLAGPGFVRPGTWGLLLMAFELLVLFRAFFQGKGKALWFLIPTFVLWANLHESFLTGLLILAAAAVGRLLDGSLMHEFVGGPGKPKDADDASSEAKASRRYEPASARTALVVLACCAAACLVNPFTYRAYEVAAYPYLHYFDSTGDITTIDQLSFFSTALQRQMGDDWYMMPAFYLVVVGLGLGSFLLNRRRFYWSRFLPFAAASVLWGLFMHSNAAFAIVFAAVIGPNCQEWYQDRFGTQGRLGTSWRLWSTGGRLVTLSVLFLTMGWAITGWGNMLPDAQFGLGYRADDFIFEAADYLSSHNEISGNILNTSIHQGDALIWKAGPKRKTYVDGRSRLFGQSLLEAWHKTRKSAQRRRRRSLEAAARSIRDLRRDDRTGRVTPYLPAVDAQPELDPVL